MPSPGEGGREEDVEAPEAILDSHLALAKGDHVRVVVLAHEAGNLVVVGNPATDALHLVRGNRDADGRAAANDPIGRLVACHEAGRRLAIDRVVDARRPVVRSDVENFIITDGYGQKVRLKELGQVKEYFSPPNIERKSKQRILKVSITPDDESACTERLERQYVHGNGECSAQVAEAVNDAYKRLLKPAIETEFSALSKEKADEEAIRVFAENLRQLLLAPPLGQKRTMGIDPGYRTGCKVVCLDAQGTLLHNEAIYPHPPKSETALAERKLVKLVEQYKIEAIAIGNGTASRETERFVTSQRYDREVQVFVVSEDGASIYSASKIARDEFPEYDVTVRGAVSIGRRLMDPLAELVKIDAKSIGVGQYQHDVDQSKLKASLDQTVESCVNLVGVNVNTASKHLLTYVSGLGPTLAQNIVDYRTENGAFHSRKELLKVPRMGAKAFEQCAGFLRIPQADNPLDNSAVHPESYAIVEKMAKDLKCSVADLIKNKELRSQIDIKNYVTDTVGLPTLTDILQELDKPGRDPRPKIQVFEFDKNVQTIDDLREGMELPGIINNITNFGCFVDIGIKENGLVHISQLADKFVSDPTTVVSMHQHVRVRVLSIDHERKRIQLTMKGLN